jgi:hypothetical protein
VGIQIRFGLNSQSLSSNAQIKDSKDASKYSMPLVLSDSAVVDSRSNFETQIAAPELT